MLPLDIQPQAREDLREAARYYNEISPALTERFFVDTEAAFSLISESPGVGSNRHAHLMPGANLKVWYVGTFPFAIFYLAHSGRLHVLRVIHERRDFTPRLFR